MFLIHLRKYNKYLLFRLIGYSTTQTDPGETCTSGNQWGDFPSTLIGFVVLLSADLRIMGQLATQSYSHSME